jgi:hypothetical protein
MAEHRFYRGDKNEREVTSDGAGTFGPRLTAKYERRFHVGVAKLCSAFLGLTLLAAADAEKHRSDYRATWWIRRRPRPPCAPISSRSAYGSAGLADDKENDVLADVMERLRDNGDGPLLIDNAIDANEHLLAARYRHMLAASKFSGWRIDSPFGMAVLSPTVE